MSTPVAKSETVRFGAFEADLRSGELRKEGIKVKLEGQPFQVLAMLLERPGDLVTREELQKQLWTDDTFVDFDQGINAAVKRLRVALEDSAETPHFIETLPRRGYRFIAPIENVIKPSLDQIPVDPTSHTSETVSAETQTREADIPHSGKRQWRAALIGSAALVLGILLVLAFNAGGLRDQLLGRLRAGEITSIAVLPLKNLTDDPRQDYLVDGMTEGLITELGKISALRVISRTSAMAFKDTNKPLPEIAHQLDVDAVLEGAVTRNGDKVSVKTRIIHSSRERIIWSKEYERDLRDISKLQSEIALVVADEIKVKLLSQEQTHLARTRQVNPRAYEKYLMGRHLQARRKPEYMQKAFSYFQQALQIDPNYTDPYIGIMDCYSIGGGRQMEVSIREADAKMREAAHKIAELDADSAAAAYAAHYASAMVKWHDWDFSGAEKEFQRALELNPEDMQIRQHYAHYLLSTRRPLDARREIQKALALDPLSPMLTVDVGHTYFYSRQFSEAINQGKKALAMEKNFPYAAIMLASSYWLAGHAQEALEVGWPNPYRQEQNLRAKAIYQRAGTLPMLRCYSRMSNNATLPVTSIPAVQKLQDGTPS